VLGGLFALRAGEIMHAGGHAALVFLGIYLASWIRPGETDVGADTADLSEGLTRLEQSVDAVAIEVERIGESQRFITQMLGEAGSRVRGGEGAGLESGHGTTVHS
jgi:hypothetical protein